MVNERVSVISVNSVDRNIAKLFQLAGQGKVVPQAGVMIHRIGDGRYSVVRMLEAGGKMTMVLEIVDGILKPAAN